MRGRPAWVPTVVIACLVTSVPRFSSAADARVEGKLRELLRDTGAPGVACLVDVRARRTVAMVGSGQDPAAAVLPLSTIKLYVASMWFDLMPAKRVLSDPKAGGVTMADVLIFGYDAPGAEAAVALRKMLGTKRMLDGLAARGLGLPPGQLELDAKTADGIWGETLSIGEKNVTVTPEQLARWLGRIGANGSPPARNLKSALRECVARGSASGVAHRLDGTGWSLGGKTGTGPASAAPNYDGIFAGLIFQGPDARYAFVIYLQGRGKGGGLAAGVAADLAKWFAGQAKGG